MSKPTYTRVRLESGAEVSVAHVTEAMEPLDVVAVDRNGRPLPPTYPATEVPAEHLKGQALDDALTAAGLPTTGKADEKRARLADYQTATGTPPVVNPEPGGDAGADA